MPLPDRAHAGGAGRDGGSAGVDHDQVATAQRKDICRLRPDIGHRGGRTGFRVSNFASVSVGTSKDTPEFAVASLARWWRYNGRHHWPDATELLVLTDGGGSNSYRARAWKYWLQHNFANRYGLAVTVCHFPTSASKWNPIEHRLFSEISKDWAGQPLTSYEMALKYISTTTTATGLTVKAYLDQRTYQTTTVTDEEMAALILQAHDIQPSRNYTICPQ